MTPTRKLASKDSPPAVSAMLIPKIVKDELLSTTEAESLVNEGKIFQKLTKSLERSRNKKLRLLRHLRKSMQPKNALIVLNELKCKDKKGIQISDFTINSNSDGRYTATVTVNSNLYQGNAFSKNTAKKLACEHALRDYTIANMKPKPRKPKPNDEKNQPSTAAEPMDVNGSDTKSEDEFPKLNLASFAIYKLFRKWKRNGYFRPANAAVPKKQKKLPGRAELPPNWQTMHPASFLCIMRPGIAFVEYDKAEAKNLRVLNSNKIIQYDSHCSFIYYYYSPDLPNFMHSLRSKEKKVRF